LSIDTGLLAAAEELSLDISRAAEDGIRIAVKREQERQWLVENRDALQSSKHHIEKHGLPLARHRLF
jgi:antitoxin CcdA